LKLFKELTSTYNIVVSNNKETLWKLKLSIDEKNKESGNKIENIENIEDNENSQSDNKIKDENNNLQSELNNLSEEEIYNKFLELIQFVE